MDHPALPYVCLKATKLDCRKQTNSSCIQQETQTFYVKDVVKGRRLVAHQWQPVFKVDDTRATLVCPAKSPALRILRTYRARIFSWLELLVARLPPSSSHSSSSSQRKSQPCIFGEYVGLVFLVTEVVGVSGVAPLWILQCPSNAIWPFKLYLSLKSFKMQP